MHAHYAVLEEEESMDRHARLWNGVDFSPTVIHVYHRINTHRSLRSLHTQHVFVREHVFSNTCIPRVLSCRLTVSTNKTRLSQSGRNSWRESSALLALAPRSEITVSPSIPQTFQKISRGAGLLQDLNKHGRRQGGGANPGNSS